LAKPKPTIVRLHEMTPGQTADFFALLAERKKSATRDGKPYYSCQFRDAKRTVGFMVWADGGHFPTCEADWRPGQFFKIRAAYVETERYGPQIDIQQIRQVTDADAAAGFQPSEFVECSRFDPNAMFAELRGLAEQHITDEPLRRMVLTLLDRHAPAWKQRPATSRNFFPFPGGLLEHTLSVTKNCLLLAEKYATHYAEVKPPINRDLVIAGAILHDIGRVAELDDDPIKPEPTVPGRFFGHLLLGRDLVRDLVPECIIIHHADDLDAKIEMYMRCLRNDKADGPFTERDPVLGRQLFKGRSV
jgi:3'-5' exoribonuclease